MITFLLIGYQVKPRQTVQQTAVEELGKPEHPPVQHGRGELLGDGGPQTEPGRVQQPTRLQHAQAADQEVVGEPEPRGLEPNEHILRVRAHRGEAQQQQLVRGERPAAQP